MMIETVVGHHYQYMTIVLIEVSKQATKEIQQCTTSNPN
jgi:hypothetical protein